MAKAEIIGFIDRIQSLPSFIITVVEINGRFYAKWPSPREDLVNLVDMNKREDLLIHGEQYWQENDNKKLDVRRKEFAFAFSRNQVFIGTAEEIIREIQKQIDIKVLSRQVLEELELILESLRSHPDSAHYFA